MLGTPGGSSFPVLLGDCSEVVEDDSYVDDVDDAIPVEIAVDGGCVARAARGGRVAGEAVVVEDDRDISDSVAPTAVDVAAGYEVEHVGSREQSVLLVAETHHGYAG